MIVSTGFISGFKFAIREKLYSFWGQVLSVPFDANQGDIVSATSIRYDASLQQQVQQMPGVKQVSPFALRPSIIMANKQMEGLRMKGITKNYQFSKGISFKGRPISFSDTGYAKDILLSQTTAARLNLQTGDPVMLYSLEPGNVRVRKLILAGIYHTGMEEVDKQFAICDIRLLQRLSNWQPDEISGYQVTLNNPELADTMASQIYDRFIQPPLESYSINHTYEGIFSWLGMQDVNARILLIIVAIMAVINLSAALLILMVDRAVMVGLLKALGMPYAGLRNIFLYLAGLISLSGLFFGNLLGLGICWAQQYFGFLHLPEDTYYIHTVPVRIIWWHIVVIDLATLVLCMLCMTLPTLYIRRIQPVRVLQFK